jgi:hypothetical protein
VNKKAALCGFFYGYRNKIPLLGGARGGLKQPILYG